MRTCDVCGNTTFHDERVSEVFRIDGQLVMVEHVPATVCDRCADATFDREIVEGVRHTVREGCRPSRHVSMDVFGFV